MPASELIALIEKHAADLTTAAVEDLIMNPRTPSFRAVPRDEAAARVVMLYQNLAGWLAEHDDNAVRAAYEDAGRTRFRQNIPISEIVYCVLIAKGQLRQYAREQGLAELQGVDGTMAEFFDRALYYLVRGYEMQAASPPRSAGGLLG